MPGSDLAVESHAGGAAPAQCGSTAMKLTLFAILAVATTVLYFGTLHASLFPAMTVPATWVDRAMPFSPLFLVPYASFFMLILLPLFAVQDRGKLLEVAFGYG